MEKKLKAENIRKLYEGKEIIKDVSLEIYKGELVSLLGVSGVGKTTLFNVLSGILIPEEGKVFLDDKDITGKAGYISYMLQKDLLMPYKTVVDNVALPLLIKGEKKKSARLRADAKFKEFGIEGSQNKYPHELSGGMRQRAALLRTYLFSNEVALLDEPFSALDTITKSKMHSWYLTIMEKIKLSTLFITHDIDEAILLSDRIYIMTGQPGKIKYEIEIETPKPRGEEFLVSEDFISYKKQILNIFNNN
ncbi:MAG: ABC transporter ATP-binding protein [Tissierella sp.]|uniref:ABC transporter ATP-binding protein n=1 Tax=Tissierella sp. TaxID=41274 RepID=UPI003F9CACE5